MQMYSDCQFASRLLQLVLYDTASSDRTTLHSYSVGFVALKATICRGISQAWHTHCIDQVESCCGAQLLLRLNNS